jgi:Ca2+-binding RTX toxin-like protein
MAVIYGKPNQTVRGTNGDDNIWLDGKADGYGLGGDDEIFGTSSNNNKLSGGDGADYLVGGEGDDLNHGRPRQRQALRQLREC